MIVLQQVHGMSARDAIARSCRHTDAVLNRYLGLRDFVDHPACALLESWMRGIYD